jgi:hypothetical protein
MPARGISGCRPPRAGVGWSVPDAGASTARPPGQEGPMKHTMKAGDRIEGLHWRAEYHPNTHHIRVLREHSEVGTYIAPRTLFGDEHTMRTATSADRRCVESALRAYLRQFAKVHDAEE